MQQPCCQPGQPRPPVRLPDPPRPTPPASTQGGRCTLHALHVSPCTALHLVALHCTSLHRIARRCTALHVVAPHCTQRGATMQRRAKHQRAVCQIARFVIRLAKYSLSSRPYATRFCDWPPSTLPRAPSLGNECPNASTAGQDQGTRTSSGVSQPRPPIHRGAVC